MGIAGAGADQDRAARGENRADVGNAAAVGRGGRRQGAGEDEHVVGHLERIRGAGQRGRDGQAEPRQPAHEPGTETAYARPNPRRAR